MSMASTLTYPLGDAGDEVLQAQLELLETSGEQLDFLVPLTTREGGDEQVTSSEPKTLKSALDMDLNWL